MALPSGSRLGPYEIISPLGAGGMGEVYRARDTRLAREVAIKILPEDLANTPEARQRFEREARAVSALNHPNICTLYDIGHDAGMDFLVMEYLEGETLAQKIRRGLLSVRETVEIATQVARGLAAAHARGIVHRDVKPSNIGLTSQGVPKIIDFGLARVVSATVGTQSQGVTTGTIGYMSPEQTIGKPVDARTDVWALGVVLSEMLSGVNPFQRENASAMLYAILNEPPRQVPSAPIGLQKIIYRALAKSPGERCADCGEMVEDLETFRSANLSAASQLAIDPSAPTATLRRSDIEKYISNASASSWPGATQHQKRLRWWIGALALPLLAVVAFTVPSVRSRITEAFSGSAEKHIAVLPFDNIGNNPANAPLAEGLMDSLSSTLSNLDVGNQSLWVVPSSVVRARKVEEPSAALRVLGATLVVKGSIEREGGDVHLTVNLINAKTLRQIGSVRLEDRAGDLATLQDETVSRLAKLMGISVTPDMLKNTGGKVNPAAYESYLTALSYIQRYDKPGNLDSGIAALNDSVKADPSFALAYCELADAYRHKYGVDPNQRWVDEALANGRKAAQLDPNLPVVYVTLARTHAMVAEYDLALQEFQRALRIEPHSPDALQGLAGTYEHMGRIADAEATFKRTAALRPDFWDGYNSLGMFYSRQGKTKEAIAQFQHVIELTPDNALAYLNLAAVYLDMNDPKVFTDAEQALKKSIELSPGYPAYTNLGLLYYNEKRFAESAAMTEKALTFNDNDYRVWSNLVATYAWLKETDKAAAARARELKLVEAVVRRQPQDAIAQSELADLYAAQKVREKALARIETALALTPDDPRVLTNVGVAYEDLGDRAAALQQIEKALARGYPLSDLKGDPSLQGLLTDPNFRPTRK